MMFSHLPQLPDIIKIQPIVVQACNLKQQTSVKLENEVKLEI